MTSKQRFILAIIASMGLFGTAAWVGDLVAPAASSWWAGFSYRILVFFPAGVGSAYLQRWALREAPRA